MAEKRFNSILKVLAKELGLPESQQDISIYTARHSFAMTLQNKGKSVEIISQALGHQSVETTKHYLAKSLPGFSRPNTKQKAPALPQVLDSDRGPCRA